MIRYVLVVLVTLAVLGVGAVAVDHATVVRGEQEAQSAVAAIDEAAVDLYESESLALAGDPPPQRVLDVRLPGAGYTSAAPDHLTFERAPGQNLTVVTYRFPSRATRSHVIEAPLVRAGERAFALDGHTGTVTLFLRLVAGDNGAPVVTLAVNP